MFDDLATVRMLFELWTLVAVEGHNATIRIDNEYGLCGVQSLFVGQEYVSLILLVAMQPDVSFVICDGNTIDTFVVKTRSA